jgi:hypothetical protein
LEPTLALATVTPSPTLTVSVPDVIEEAPAEQAIAAEKPFYSPPRDYYDVAQRLGGEDIGPRTVTRTIYSADDIGVEQTFFVDDNKVKATLYAVTDRAYFWIDNGMQVDVAEVQAAADRLENDLYPIISNLFGSEWTPGVDNDPHFSVVHLSSYVGQGELGFFVAANQYPRSVERRSNEQEVIFMNMDALTFGDDLYFGTLVHEIQHLIHWNQDPNEEVWLDEGLGQLAEIASGFETADTVDYMRNTSTQLNGWEYDDEEAVFAHYAAGYLFSVYLWEQLGDAAIRDLIEDEVNGMASVRNVLAKYHPDQSFESFVGDWAIANLLDDPESDPRYGYRSIDPGLPSVYDRVKLLPATIEGALPPFGVHYIDIGTTGNVSMTFSAETETRLFPSPPSGSETVWYAPPADNLDATLTTELDLTDVDEASLAFWAWHDLEEGYDFAYVLVSADDGETWEIVTPEPVLDGEFGPALSGRSVDIDSAEDEWIKLTLDLGDYIGRKLRLRFEVLTDYAVSGRGFAVDTSTFDPKLNWVTDGFLRHDGEVQPGWMLRLVDRDTFGEVVVDAFDSADGLTLGSGTLIVINGIQDQALKGVYTLKIGDSAE